tara:strand:- start:5340 stop:6242 length:903 start_codon:yes stop_codon:yes gene_type:complete
MNILITGGAGFLGNEISQLLSKKNKIFLFDLNKIINKKNIFSIKGNINDSKILKKKIKEYKIDTLIHLAAAIGVEKTEKNPDKVIKINIKGTTNVLKSIEGSNVKNIIFASSSEIYGEGNKKKVKETDLPKPKSIYAHTKIIGEQLFKIYAIKNRINYKIVRFFNVCGKGQKNDFVISKFADRILNNKEILIFGNGKQIRSFCHVKDAARGFLKVLNKGKNDETYNIGNNSEPINILKLANKMIKISKKNCKIKKIPFERSDRSAKREIYYRVPDLSKIRKHTKYKAKISLDKIISEFYL